MSGADLELFVGVYDTGETGGLHPLSYKAEGERWALGPADKAIRNASYAAWDPKQDIYIFVNERSAGRLGCYRRQRTKWFRIAEVGSGGSAPCFVEIGPDGDLVVAANYESGEVGLFALKEGHLAPLVNHRNQGCGPDSTRQAGPHPHCARFAYGRIYSVDLGTDEVLVHAPHAAGGFYVAYSFPPGQGPRQIVFHPRWPVAYVLTELGSSLFTLAVGEEGKLTEIQMVSTLPAGFKGASLGGHLQLNQAADRLYVSNRGHDSIAVFDVSGEKPRHEQTIPTGGSSPRHFRLLEPEGRIVVAHEQSGGLTVLTLKQDGSVGEKAWQAPLAKAAFVGVVGRM